MPPSGLLHWCAHVICTLREYGCDEEGKCGWWDSFKLMPIDQPPSHIETGPVCGSAWPGALRPSASASCPLLLSLFFCVYVYMDTVCGWVGRGTHDACCSLRVEVGECHCGQFFPPTFMCVLRVRLKPPDLHSKHPYQSKHLIGLASS